MRHLRLVSLAVIGLGLGMAGLPAVTSSSGISAQAAESDKANSVRPEVGRPLQAAQDLIKQQKYRDALAKLREAEAVGSLTAYESGLVEQLRGSAASGAGDYAAAAKAYETYLSAAHPEPATQLKLIQAVATFYYQAKDYGKAATWANRYLSEGGNDTQTRTLLAQSYYQAEDYANAANALQDLIKQQPATEQQLQLLANAYVKTDDQNGYRATLEKLVANYPKPDYWTDLLRRVSTRSGFAERLQLDSDRLGLAVGSLNNAADYVELAELALQAGLPGEAKAAIEKGFSKGLLGSGADAERHKRLRDLAAKKADEDLKSLPASEKEAANGKDGTGLVNTGLDYLGYGQSDKAVALIEQGIQKGGLKHPDDAQLHLGLAYLAAGHKDKAAQAFKLAQGSDGASDLARLWSLHVSHSAS